ncbi:MAG: hypothetical protein ABW046_13315 [Actinoplanes sp.]
MADGMCIETGGWKKSVGQVAPRTPAGRAPVAATVHRDRSGMPPLLIVSVVALLLVVAGVAIMIFKVRQNA